MEDVESWFKSLPFFTRHYMLGCLIGTAASSLQLVSADKLALSYDGIFKHHYFWTILTNFFVAGNLSFHFLIRMYFIYYAVGSIERHHTPGKYPDFLYLIMVCAGLVLVYSIIAGKVHYLSNPFILSLLYIYSKKEPLKTVRFMFGFVFKNAYLPWVLLIYDLFTGQSVLPLLVGIAAGHTYIVLKDILPFSKYKLNLLKTPPFVYQLAAKLGPEATNPAPQAAFGARNNQQNRPNQGMGMGGIRPQMQMPQAGGVGGFFGGQGMRIG